MIITIDVGNTNITVVFYNDEGQELYEFRLITKTQRTGDEFGLILKNFLDCHKICLLYTSPSPRDA